MARLLPVVVAGTMLVAGVPDIISRFDQSGRTGLVNRHSTAGLAVVAAAVVGRMPPPSQVPRRDTDAVKGSAVAFDQVPHDRAEAGPGWPRAHLRVTMSSFVETLTQLYPTGVGAALGRMRMRAVHADAPRVYVEPAMDSELVARVSRHPRRQVDVVVDLDQLSGCRLEPDVLVSAGPDRLSSGSAVEGDLGAGLARADCGVEGPVVDRIALTPAPGGQSRDQGGAGRPCPDPKKPQGPS